MASVHTHMHVMEQSCFHVTTMLVKAKSTHPNCHLDNYVYSHIILLSTLIREVSFCSAKRWLQRCVTGQSKDNKWLLDAQPYVSCLYSSPTEKTSQKKGKQEVKSWRTVVVVMWNTEFWAWHGWCHVIFFFISSGIHGQWSSLLFYLMLQC